MKIGDIILNPYVRESSPLRRTMVINIGRLYVKTIRYDGVMCAYRADDVKRWSKVGHADIAGAIQDTYKEVSE